jgi:hypothetical protein
LRAGIAITEPPDEQVASDALVAARGPIICSRFAAPSTTARSVPDSDRTSPQQHKRRLSPAPKLATVPSGDR